MPGERGKLACQHLAQHPINRLNASGFSKFLWRDGSLALLAMLLWQTGSDSGRLAIPTGLLTLYCGFALHEWGHVAGARLSQALIYPARSIAAPFIYNFDATANSSRQFLATSVAGFIATAIFLLLFWWVLPDSGAGLIAQRGAAVLAAATVIFEFPIAIAVALGRPIPSLVLLPDQRQQRLPDNAGSPPRFSTAKEPLTHD